MTGKVSIRKEAIRHLVTAAQNPVVLRSELRGFCSPSKLTIVLYAGVDVQMAKSLSYQQLSATLDQSVDQTGGPLSRSDDATVLNAGQPLFCGSRYPGRMTSPEDIDPDFLKALAGHVGASQEFEFERRGTGDSTYTLHGQIVAVDAEQGTIQIRRTRTHAGEVHEMGLRYFLSATSLTDSTLINRVAAKRNQAFRERQQARVDAVGRASKDPAYRPCERTLRSTFVGRRQGVLEGYPGERFVYRDLEDPNRRVGLIAKSFAAVEQFMAMQDIFMPLDDMLWHAIDGGVLWPAGIAFDKQADPEAWSVDWLKLYEELAGLSPSVLRHYLHRVHSGYVEFGSFVPLTDGEVQLLLGRGLLQHEEPPTSTDEVLTRIPMKGLRQLLRESGSKFKATTRDALVAELQRQVSPAMAETAKRLMRPPKLQLKAPAGLSIEAFDRAVNELKDSIFVMRQWLRATWELYREDELRQLVDVV